MKKQLAKHSKKKNKGSKGKRTESHMTSPQRVAPRTLSQTINTDNGFSCFYCTSCNEVTQKSCIAHINSTHTDKNTRQSREIDNRNHFKKLLGTTHRICDDCRKIFSINKDGSLRSHQCSKEYVQDYRNNININPVNNNKFLSYHPTYLESETSGNCFYDAIILLKRQFNESGDPDMPYFESPLKLREYICNQALQNPHIEIGTSFSLHDYTMNAIEIDPRVDKGYGNGNVITEPDYEAYWSWQKENGIYAEDAAIIATVQFLQISRINIWTRQDEKDANNNNIIHSITYDYINAVGSINMVLNLLMTPGTNIDGINSGGHFKPIIEYYIEDDLKSLKITNQRDIRMSIIGMEYDENDRYVNECYDREYPGHDNEGTDKSSREVEVDIDTSNTTVKKWKLKMVDLFKQLHQQPRHFSKIFRQIMKLKHPKAKITPSQNSADLFDEEDISFDEPDKREIMLKNCFHALKQLKTGDAIAAIRALTSKGILSIKDPIVRDNILTKYPGSILIQQNLDQSGTPESLSETNDFEDNADIALDSIYDDDSFDDVGINDDIIFPLPFLDIDFETWLASRKNGKAGGMSGLKSDHMKSLVKDHPEIIPHITYLMNIITSGNLPDNCKHILRIGRGIALRKKEDSADPRPIQIGEFFDNAVSGMLSTRYKYTIREFCGNTQLGNAIPGGSEAMIHTIRSVLESGSKRKILLKIDLLNAFNSTNRTNIQKTINDHFPEDMKIYAKILLSEKSTISYYCQESKKCMVINYEKGVPQGNACSGAFFNIGQASCVKEVLEEFPNIILVSFHDDHHILGDPDDTIIAAYDKLTSLLELRCHNLVQKGKSLAYSFSEIEEDLKAELEIRNIKVVPHTEGLIINGSPVGSLEYMKTENDKIVDNIIAIFDIVADLVLHGYSTTGPRAQAAMYILRLCGPSQYNHILRTCPPQATVDAASKLDKALFKLATALTRLTSRLPREKRLLDNIINRFHLPIRRGGAGVTNSRDIAHAAYVASWALCGKHIGIIDKSLIYTAAEVASKTPTPAHLVQLNESIQKINSEFNNVVEDITITNIWEISFPKIQYRIKNRINEALFNKIVEALPVRTGKPNNSGFDSPSALEIHRHHVGRDSPIANAHMSAHPVYRDNQFTDDEFTEVFGMVLNVPYIEPHAAYCRECSSRDYVDPYGGHGFHCSKIHGERGEMHTGVKETLLNAIHRLRPGTNTFRDREPNLLACGYYNTDVRNPKCRGDIRIKNDKFIKDGGELIIDVSTAHNCANYIKDYEKAGVAADKREIDKIEEYSRSLIDFKKNIPGRPPVLMFTVETSGALGTQAKKFCQLLCDPSSVDYSLKLQYLYQSLSVSIVRSRVHQMVAFNKHFSNQPPQQPPYGRPCGVLV